MLDRRDFLTFGTVALGGFALPAAGRRPPRAGACILLYMDGGPSHIDLWDMKPDAPAEVRGPFRPAATSVPGVRVCEHLPHTARVMHRLLQIRSVRHKETIHDPAVYEMLTGRKHPISAGGLKVAPTDFPHLGSLLAHGDSVPVVMPRAIELPETMKMEGRTLPGQNAGFLGASCDPFRVEVSPEGEVRPPEFAPLADLNPRRLRGRSRLLAGLDGRLERLESSGRRLDGFQRQAFALLQQPRVREAFRLESESDRVRDNYGRHRQGQSVLLARRLVEAGSRFVTVYWGREKQDWADGRGPRFANNPWDTHRNHFPLLKDDLLPRADQTLAALVADLAARGLLDSTLVVWMGDFGRTPRIDRKYASRDHWPGANTVLLAGAGVPGGGVLGRTDRLAAEVVADPVSPADLTATILHFLGVRPESRMKDASGREHPLSEGDVIRGI
jgi:hypothetical protein